MLASTEAIDTTYDPAEERVPETLLHLLIRTMLFDLVRRHTIQRGVRALVGSDQLICW